MATFLQVLGAIFLTFIILGFVVVFGGKFLIKRKLNQFTEEIHKAAKRESETHNQGQGHTYDYDELQRKETKEKNINE